MNSSWLQLVRSFRAVMGLLTRPVLGTIHENCPVAVTQNSLEEEPLLDLLPGPLGDVLGLRDALGPRRFGAACR